ncbi:MAG: DUF6502 family protein [Desulfuromonadales bacterium]|nr:DUF6502 family protein [Desulfuromonadales bacterium]
MQQVISHTIIKLLSPLIRILLRNGTPFGVFAELARWVYVDLAIREFAIKGRKPSDSRASIITGLSRKEVHRLRSTEPAGEEETGSRYNRAARVISAWVRQDRFHDTSGQPLELPVEHGPVTFNDLVKQFSGDIPTRAILDELVRVGAVELTLENKVKLLTRAYVPQADTEQKLEILGSDVADLIQTIGRNLETDPQGPLFQRKVAYNNLPIEAVTEFKKLAAQKNQELLEEFDRFLSGYDRDLHPHQEGTGRWRAGVGIYYFDEDLELTGSPDTSIERNKP